MDNSLSLDFWTGPDGDAYQARNASNWQGVKSRSRMFGDIFEKMGTNFPLSILEVGAGAGDNLRAIDMLYERTRTKVKLLACDPNGTARDSLCDVADMTVDAVITDLPYNDASLDMVFTSGVLIHLPPDDLPKAMGEIHRVSRRWVLSIEYFNPTPQAIDYRGKPGLLWRRDWGMEWLKLYPELRPAGYGFMWKHETGLDNVTWFLFEKPQL